MDISHSARVPSRGCHRPLRPVRMAHMSSCLRRRGVDSTRGCHSSPRCLATSQQTVGRLFAAVYASYGGDLYLFLEAATGPQRSIAFRRCPPSMTTSRKRGGQRWPTPRSVVRKIAASRQPRGWPQHADVRANGDQAGSGGRRLLRDVAGHLRVDVQAAVRLAGVLTQSWFVARVSVLPALMLTMPYSVTAGVSPSMSC